MLNRAGMGWGKKKKKNKNTYLNLAGERGVGGNIPGSKESK